MTGKHRKPSRLRRVARTAAPLAVIAGLGVTPSVASAQPLPDFGSPDALPQAPTRADIDDFMDRAQVPGEVRDAVEPFLPPAEPQPAPVPAPAPAPAPAPVQEERAADLPPESPCPETARACVDLAGNRTWLQQDGKLLYGPTVMSHGKPGQETPKGTFTVTRKVKDEISHEFNNAPMPYAVYFTNNGHAFHEGSTDVQSAGCVRLPHDAAKFFFENLQVGDVVYIY